MLSFQSMAPNNSNNTNHTSSLFIGTHIIFCDNTTIFILQGASTACFDSNCTIALSHLWNLKKN
jgi:hypothetical protein